MYAELIIGPCDSPRAANKSAKATIATSQRRFPIKVYNRLLAIVIGQKDENVVNPFPKGPKFLSDQLLHISCTNLSASFNNEADASHQKHRLS